ncbi:hypothetical protein QCA50_016060 [Cerrena zonata]|uniref:Uncharacterized protein n=1 Tax=Cerrena zonata TaxID=2478898 RepID=A0AAW0FKR7_9APHY
MHDQHRRYSMITSVSHFWSIPPSHSKMRNMIPEQYINSFGLSGTANYDYDYRLVDIPQTLHTPLILSSDNAPDFDRFQHILADRIVPIIEPPVQQIGPLVSTTSTPSLEEESSVEGGVIDEVSSQGPTSRYRKFRERTSKFIEAVHRRFRAARQRFRL